jgi:hypothetical protein
MLEANRRRTVTPLTGLTTLATRRGILQARRREVRRPMHTMLVIGGGLLMLAACVAVGYMSNGRGGARQAALVFLPVWLLGAGINMYVGVSRAGYTVAQELPILVVVFIVPALAALGFRRGLKKPS